ncbi:variable large family protein [Borrelia venezuelensis]|uniref:variable large family protein n=1 Tax=Borrelia venezuelensis TaxID=1653839 RepID=UPI001FF2F88B|nr:variable large family protein [Borrelia venezuelensis]UPA12823.1 variable large family protein [Borrelia venezuelensis]
MLFFGCGSGSTSAENSQSRFLKSLISLGNDFLNVFTSLSDMVGGVLGFNTNTKKSDVGNYFKTIEKSLTTTKTSLEKIVSDMKSENNPNASAVETAVTNLVNTTLDKITQGAKTVSEAIGDANDPLGNVAAQGSGGVAGDIDKLVQGIKLIVELVLKEGKHDAGTDKKASDGSTSRTANGGTDEAGKLFGTTSNSGVGAAAGDAKKVAADAAKAVGAVTGADILKAMVKNSDAAAASAKDGTIAGAMALRAMAKNGKFPGVTATAAADNPDYTDAVKGAAVSAVTKALGTLTIAIRKTIDLGLKEVKDAMKINPDSTTPADAAIGGQNSK